MMAIEYMCPNCVTPWKCNGPHIPEGEAMDADWKRLDRHGLSSEPGQPVLMAKTVSKLDEYADRITELEAKLDICKKYRDAYAECDRIGTQSVRDIEAKLKQATAFIEDFASHKFEVLRAPSARHPADQEDDVTPLPMVEAYQEDARDVLAAITNPGGVDQPHTTD